MDYIFRLSLSSGNDNIQCVDLVDLEFVIIDLLIEGFLVDDAVVSVDQMLFQFVGKHTFEGIHFVGFSDLLDSLGNGVVDVSGLELSQSGLDRLVSSQNNIGLSTGNGSIDIRLHNDGVSDECDITVDVHTQVDLDEVTFLDSDAILFQRRVVSADLVDGEAGGEGDTLVHWLLVVDLGALAFNEPVGKHAGVNNLNSHLEVSKHLTQHV